MRGIRIYAITTCLKNEWGTRNTVEILHVSDEQA